MSVKRFNLPGVMIVLLALALVGGGCATTSSETAQYKPHKPQMITSESDKEAPFMVSDGWASFLNAVGQILWGCAGGPSLP